MGLRAAASAADAAIHKKIMESGTTTLIILDKEWMIVNSVKESGLLIKGVSEEKERKGGFLRMLLGPLDASLLENVWTGKRSRI